MRFFKLTLSYDGTNYHGFQMQPRDVTIQSTVENALSKLFKADIKITGCSRTDAGVHAKKYVCNFAASGSIPAHKVPVALSTFLPDDIIALECDEVDETFHSRYNAKYKTYIYTINVSRFGDVFTNNFEWHFGRSLDIDLMNKACKYIIGKHDFKSFMAAGSIVKDTIRTVTDLKVTEHADRVRIFITADGFLYNMVRIIAGTLINVGIGKISPAYIKTIIDGRNRTLAGFTAPAKGLVLFDVIY